MLKYTNKIEVTSERDNIKKIIFGRDLTIIWDNNTATVYKYEWLKNIGDARMVDQ